MKIGIIGAGMIGSTAARLFVRSGHEVAISNSRGATTLGAQEPGVLAADVAEAAAFGDVVLLAIPLPGYRSLPTPALVGKVVVDAMNYYTARHGDMGLSADLTTSELVARSMPDAQLVKAFNTLYFETLATGGRPDAPYAERIALPLAGDDAGAKDLVRDLIEQIGFGAVDTGLLAGGGRLQQPGTPLFNTALTVAEAERVIAGQVA